MVKKKISIFWIVIFIFFCCGFSFASWSQSSKCKQPPWHNHPQLVKKLDAYDALSTTLKEGVYEGDGYLYFYAEQIDVRSCLGVLVVEPIFVVEEMNFIEIIYEESFKEILSACINSPLDFDYHSFIPRKNTDGSFNYSIVKVVPLISDVNRYERLPEFPLKNLKHHSITSCKVKLKGRFVEDINPIFPKFKSIYKPKNPPKKIRMALRLEELTIKD